MWIFYHHWALSEPVINSKSVLFGSALKGIKPQKRSFNDRQVVNRHLCVVNWCPHSSTIFERANKLRRALNLRAIASPFGGCYGRRWKKAPKWSADSIWKHSKSSVLALWGSIGERWRRNNCVKSLNRSPKITFKLFFPPSETWVDAARGQSNFCKSSLASEFIDFRSRAVVSRELNEITCV